MAITILEQGRTLIVSMPPDAADGEMFALQSDLADRIGARDARGVVIDVSAMVVLDSFATRMLETLAHVSALRGAAAVVVGIQPEVAMAMVQLGVTLQAVETARDLEDGIERLRLMNADAP